MAVPKKRTSVSRKKTRRSHHHLERTFANICSSCGEPVLRHRVCMACGQYRGKQIVSVNTESLS